MEKYARYSPETSYELLRKTSRLRMHILKKTSVSLINFSRVVQKNRYIFMSRGSSASYAGIIKYRDFSKKIFPLEKYETAKKKKKERKKKKTDQKSKRSSSNQANFTRTSSHTHIKMKIKKIHHFNHITNLHLRQIRVLTKFGSEDIKIRMKFQPLH